ncbi:MAG: BTAD domain-containing putative transcriptional regulator [Thermoleophilaceae bacterium]
MWPRIGGEGVEEPNVQVRVLGPFELVVDGRPRPVPGGGERALLALLASSPGRTIARDRLVDELWGAELPVDPVNALQLRVSKLRKVVGSALVTEPSGYRLELDREQVDAGRFARLVAERRFEEGLALWRGPPLGEFEDQHWARAEAARLEELHATAVEEHIETRLAAGEHAALVPELTRLVDAAPLRERPLGQLMVALHRCGRAPDALAAYQDFRHRLADKLGLTPSAALRQLEGAILREDSSLDAPSAAQRPSTNLPAPISPLVGRAAELERLPELLSRSRLVSLVGPGGSGKTRLAIAAAQDVAIQFRDGAWFVPLAGLTDPARIPEAVAEALALSDPDSVSPRRLVTAWLASRNALLVVDNCEHLVDQCANFVEELLGSAEDVRIIATSREALGVPDEIQMPVGPLPHADAAALFTERARSVRPDFAPVDAEDDVSRICQRLDGMPLAIELAATRVQTLTVGEIAERLDDRFALLTSGPRTAEARHQTLRAAVDWSYELLGEEERALLRRLAVFQEGWSLEAAEGVCLEGDSSDVLALVSGLAERSLVVAEDGRFRMLETIRVYALERLAEAGEEGAMRERHARYFTALAERVEPALRGRDQGVWLARLRAEDANLRLALQSTRDRATSDPDEALRLAAALGWYWYVGRQVDGRVQLTETLAATRAGAPSSRARALQALSLAVRPAGCIVHPSSEGAQAARESISLFTDVDEPARAALSRLLLAVEAVAGDDVQSSLADVEEARKTLRAQRDEWGVALADFVEMEIRLHNGPADEALHLGDEAASQFDALQDIWGRSAVRLHLGHGLRLAGRAEDAIAVLHQAAALSQDAGLPNNLARSLIELGEAALYRGAADEAERWFAQGEQIARDLANDTMLALALLGRATTARWRRNPTLARQLYADALELCLAGDQARGEARARLGLAGVDLDEGATAGARDRLEQALSLAGATGDAGITAGVLEQRGRLATAATGDDAERVRLLAEADALRSRHHRPRSALEDRDAYEAGHPRALSRRPRNPLQ